jgi:hypothetical protein
MTRLTIEELAQMSMTDDWDGVRFYVHVAVWRAVWTDVRDAVCRAVWDIVWEAVCTAVRAAVEDIL